MSVRHGPFVRLLDADPDLGESLTPEARKRATEMLQVRVATIPPGPWAPPTIGPAAIGLLVLDGLMVRRVRVGRSSSTELIGPTDMLRPGDNQVVPPVLPTVSDWRILPETPLAVSDGVG